MRQLHHVRTRIGGVQGGQGNRLKGSVSGEPRCRLCALITLRAVHSDLVFAVSKVADLPDKGLVPPTYLATLGSGALHERELVSSARPVRPVTKANRIK